MFYKRYLVLDKVIWGFKLIVIGWLTVVILQKVLHIECPARCNVQLEFLLSAKTTVNFGTLMYPPPPNRFRGGLWRRDGWPGFKVTDGDWTITLVKFLWIAVVSAKCKLGLVMYSTAIDHKAIEINKRTLKWSKNEKVLQESYNFWLKRGKI